MMYGWNDGWGWGAWVAMGLMMVVFWGLLVAGIIVVWRSVGRRDDGPARPDTSRGDNALRILDERLARGEIDADEYTHRRDLLRAP